MALWSIRKRLLPTSGFDRSEREYCLPCSQKKFGSKSNVSTSSANNLDPNVVANKLDFISNTSIKDFHAISNPITLSRTTLPPSRSALHLERRLWGERSEYRNFLHVPVCHAVVVFSRNMARKYCTTTRRRGTPRAHPNRRSI